MTYRVTEVDSAKRRAKAEVRITNETGAIVAVAVNILQWVKSLGAAADRGPAG